LSHKKVGCEMPSWLEFRNSDHETRLEEIGVSVPGKENCALSNNGFCAEQPQSDQAFQFNHGNSLIPKNRAISQADCPAE
jgi:hypothetical protein